MEVFTKRKPTDECFTGEMTLRHCVNDSLHNSLMDVIDTSLLEREDAHFAAKEECVSSVLSLAINCTSELPNDRIDMRTVVSQLVKIKATLLAKTAPARPRRRA